MVGENIGHLEGDLHGGCSVRHRLMKSITPSSTTTIHPTIAARRVVILSLTHRSATKLLQIYHDAMTATRTRQLIHMYKQERNTEKIDSQRRTLAFTLHPCAGKERQMTSRLRWRFAKEGYHVVIRIDRYRSYASLSFLCHSLRPPCFLCMKRRSRTWILPQHRTTTHPHKIVLCSPTTPPQVVSARLRSRRQAL